MTFKKFPTNLHMCASKSLSNFEGITHRMHQYGIWYSPNYRCCLYYAESDATHTMRCANTILVAIRKNIIERLVCNESKLDGNQTTMDTLLQHMLDKPSTSPLHLDYMSSCYKKHSLRSLWHGNFPQDVAESIHNDRLSGHMIMSKSWSSLCKLFTSFWLIDAT